MKWSSSRLAAALIIRPGRDARSGDLGALREHLSEWHLWEARNGTLRPLLPGDTLTHGCEQLRARRDAQHPWQLDLLRDRSHDQ